MEQVAHRIEQSAVALPLFVSRLPRLGLTIFSAPSEDLSQTLGRCVVAMHSKGLEQTALADIVPSDDQVHAREPIDVDRVEEPEVSDAEGWDHARGPHPSSPW